MDFRERGAAVRREERRLTAARTRVRLCVRRGGGPFPLGAAGAPRPRRHTANGVDTETFDPERRSDPPFQGQGAAFAFTGAMDYLPNIDAVTWFANEVFPSIRQVLPGAQFLIVGSKPTAEVRKLAGCPACCHRPRSVSRRVSRARAGCGRAAAHRARIQNKVLEAMAMAMPTVVSSGP